MAPRKTTKKSTAAKKTTASKKSTAKKSSNGSTNNDVTTMNMSSSADAAAMQENNWRKKFFIPIVIVLLAILAYVGMQQLVAATVNGRPISRITLAREMETQFGEQILDTLVTKQLILQAAQEQNIAVSEEEIEAEIAELRQQFEASGQSFEDVVALQGYTMEKVREEIRIQKIVEKAVSAEIEISDEEIDGFIEQNSAFMPEDQDTSDPAFREEIKDQLMQQEVGTRMQSWVEDLKAQADIRYFGPFKKEVVPAPAMQMPEGEMNMEMDESVDTTAPPSE